MDTRKNNHMLMAQDLTAIAKQVREEQMKKAQEISPEVAARVRNPSNDLTKGIHLSTEEAQKQGFNRKEAGNLREKFCEGEVDKAQDLTVIAAALRMQGVFKHKREIVLEDSQVFDDYLPEGPGQK